MTERAYLDWPTVRDAKPRPDGKDRFIWDAPALLTKRGKPLKKPRHDAVAGFCLRVAASGRKTYEFQYRAPNGRARRMVIAVVGEKTAEDARAKAFELKAQVRDDHDPLAERAERRQQAREASASISTVADLAVEYLERHAKRHKRTWADDEARLSRHILPELGPRALATVTRADVRSLYEKIGREAGPYEAEHVRALLSVMFSKAADWEHFTGANPAKLPKSDRFKTRDRNQPLREDELPRILDAIRSQSSPYVRAFFELLLLTGLRMSELRTRRWDDLDRAGRRLRLGRTKSGREIVVPLSEAAVELFVAIPRRVGSPFIFPSTSDATAPLSRSWLSRQWLGRKSGKKAKPFQGIREKAGCPHLRIHDLRHTVATYMANAGTPAQDIQKALGHQSLRTTMKYVHAADTGARAALESLGAAVGRQRRGERERGRHAQ